VIGTSILSSSIPALIPRTQKYTRDGSMEIQWKTAKWKPDTNTNSSHSVLGRIKLHHFSTFKDCDFVIVHPRGHAGIKMHQEIHGVLW
jgi:hypothetical protein